MTWRMFVRMLIIIGVAMLCTREANCEEREETKLFKVLGLVHYSLQASDVVTTEFGLAHGAEELNPAMQSRAVRLAMKPTVSILSNYSTARLYQSKPKLALGLRIGMCALYGYAVAHNLREIRRLR